MKQDPITEVLLPLNSKDINPINNYTWDYVYEPESYELIDGLALRYVETITHQALVENIASEQSARMVAMKAATDNAGNVIEELKLVYNKTSRRLLQKSFQKLWRCSCRLITSFIEVSMVEGKLYNVSERLLMSNFQRRNSKKFTTPENG